MPGLTSSHKSASALYGSLALTGLGHATDKAVLLGLMGETPNDLDPESVDGKLSALATSGEINLLGQKIIAFDILDDVLWHKNEVLPGHPNGLSFIFETIDGQRFEKVFYSTGGGFIYSEDELNQNSQTKDSGKESVSKVPYPFGTMNELLEHGRRTGLSIAEMLRSNELTHCSENELDAGLDKIWSVMHQCIQRGLKITGELPGGLHVQRRAAKLWLTANEITNALPHDGMHKVSLYAMAVNEENAAGGRVVTAPTNGAAGIIPAILLYYSQDCKPSDPVKGIRNFMLVASAIGMLCKKNASISGAEIGCQGEVGVACAMAAAGLTSALGGTNEQIESAAEIGIEHHLGMTCDPIGGLVQIPCIERNGMGAVKAITAASLALKSDGKHHVSLDQVIETMRHTGFDMQAKYKETSLGGLAVHVITVNHAAC